MREPKSRLLLFLFGLAAFTATIWGIAAAKDFFVPISLAALLAFGMAPVTQALRRWRFPEWLSVVCAVLLVIVPLAGVIYLAVVEIRHAVNELPRILAAVQEAAEQFKASHFAHTWHLSGYLEGGALSNKLGEMASSGAMVFLGGMLTALSAGTTLILLLILAIAMLASRRHLRRSADYALRVYTNSESSLVDEVVDLIQAFLLARFGVTAIAGAACWIVLVSFGIPYSFLLALIYGFATWVPVVGVGLGLLPVIVVAIAVGKTIGVVLGAGLLLLGAWILQDHVLQPKWLGGKLRLNFFATYLALFAGGQLWGPWGMFLSVPLLGVLRILFAASEPLKPIALAMSEDEVPEVDATHRRTPPLT